MEVKDCSDRLRNHEAGINQLMTDVGTIQKDMDMGPRVAALVGALQQVAPKVMDQENAVRDLTERVGRMESRGGVPSASAASAASAGSRISNSVTSEAALARIGRLEVEVSRLTLELEGEDDDALPHVCGNDVVAGSADADEETSETVDTSPRRFRRASATE